MKRIILSIMFILSLVAVFGQDEALTIDDSGNVGINNSSPEATLDVSGSVKISENLIIDQNIILDGNLDTPGIITADQFKMNNGTPLIQMVQYWRVNQTLNLTSSWQTIGGNKTFKAYWDIWFPGYTDMEVHFFYVGYFGSNQTTIATQLSWYDGTWKSHTLGSSTRYSYGRNYTYAGFITMSDFPTLAEGHLQARETQGSDGAVYDVFIILRPIFD